VIKKYDIDLYNDWFEWPTASRNDDTE